VSQRRGTRPAGVGVPDAEVVPRAPGQYAPAVGAEANPAVQRFKIETFHKVLKSGRQAERARLRTAERLADLLAVLCVVAWRIFWLTMTSPATPEARPEVALTEAEIEILDRLAGGAGRPTKPTVGHYLVAVARLGGYLARSKDPPPGNMAIWRGLNRLMDIHLGFELSCGVVGH
jgi:hypothetical protein